MNKVNTKISFFSNIQNMIKENIKIIIYFVIFIVIIFAGYQIILLIRIIKYVNLVFFILMQKNLNQN